jgi:predicted DNA-binding transcriptional regulator YafY
VRDTAARLLTLLSLLQSRAEWPGSELASRLGVSTRTIRKDISRLRELGYPVDAVQGPAGHYRLGAGATLPPLLLDDEEAVAIAVGLRAGVRFDYHDPGRHSPPAGARPARLVEPYRLVNWQRRWYLVAREPGHGAWQVLRVDWIALRTPDGPRFNPVSPPEDYTDLVLREVASTGWKVRARIAVAAPADTVLARINPAVGIVETVDENNSILATGADSLATVAAYVGMLEVDFRVAGRPSSSTTCAGSASATCAPPRTH